jgi:hypothetical protein
MPNRWLPALVVSSAMAAVVLTGCDRGGSPDATPVATNPPNTGATCDDPTGDLSRAAGERGGSLKEPAGIDLTHAQARVTDNALQVSFATAGPIASAPNPELRLGQGQPGQVDSFELVATPPSPGPGPWELRLVTFRPDGRGGVAEAPRTVLSVPVTVSGNTLSYEVPLHDLPAIASYVWLFGSSSTADPEAETDDTIIDDCDNYAGSGSTTSVPAPTTAAVGETQTYRTGSQVTVEAIEKAAGDAGTTNVAIDAKVCAPASNSIETKRDDFAVSAADDRTYPAKDVTGARDPAFPATVVLDPGACRRAWVTVPVPATTTPVTVVYSPDPSGSGALRWRVP